MDDVALEKHVVDGILSEEQLPDHLGRPGSSITIGSWEQARRALRRQPPALGRGPYVAVLRIEGMIVDGRSDRLPVNPPIEVPLVSAERAGDLTVVQLARQVAADKRAAAAVLYVNSRGGSSTASEAMRQALERINSRKPLVVAMGHPLGVRGALTAGIIHAIGPITPGGRAWIQADVRLAPGNSGGPLADASGRVMGLNAMVAGALALAIPMAHVERFVRAAGVEPP